MRSILRSNSAELSRAGVASEASAKLIAEPIEQLNQAEGLAKPGEAGLSCTLAKPVTYVRLRLTRTHVRA